MTSLNHSTSLIRRALVESPRRRGRGFGAPPGQVFRIVTAEVHAKGTCTSAISWEEAESVLGMQGE